MVKAVICLKGGGRIIVNDVDQEEVQKKLNEDSRFIHVGNQSIPIADIVCVKYEDPDGEVPKPAAVLYAFMGWLTSREKTSGPFSAHYDAGQAAVLVSAFCKSQGWDESPPENWTETLKPYPDK